MIRQPDQVLVGRENIRLCTRGHGPNKGATKEPE